MSHELLVEIWLWSLAFLLGLVVLLDGYDLGVGMMCLLEPEERRREIMMASIEGTWHSNQTWLIILGGALFGAFPRAYGVFLSSMYLPAGLLLLALIARGVGLEYYSHATHKRLWSNIFGWGSLAIALVEGAMVGAVIQGLSLGEERHFPDAFAWLGTGALVGALSLACLTGALGAGWANDYSAGFRQHRAGMLLVLGSVVFQAGLAALLPVSVGPWAIGLAALAVALAALAVTAMDTGRRFFVPLALHGLFCLGAWMAMLRPGLNPMQAAAGPESLKVMTVVFAVMVPVILGYSVYQFLVFRNYALQPPRHSEY